MRGTSEATTMPQYSGAHLWIHRLLVYCLAYYIWHTLIYFCAR